MAAVKWLESSNLSLSVFLKGYMDIQKNWDNALRNTKIVRARIKNLLTFADTEVPYVLLSKSSINFGDTVVRKGDVIVSKPSLILPPNIPQLKGFDLEDKADFGENMLTSFFMVRGVTMPSFKYNNETYSIGVREGGLDQAVSYYKEKFQRKEDVHTGLLVAPEECWQFSLLIYMCMQTAKNTEDDIRNLLEKYQSEGK